MRRAVIVTCLALTGFHPASGDSAAPPPPMSVTLERALEEAFQRNPVLAAERARVREAEGRGRTARTYPFNPEVSLEAARRRGPSGRSTDRELRLTQELEIAGQRARRVAQAAAELEAARASLRRVERMLAADVRLAFALALRARELHRIESANVELARSLVQLERRRYEAGATSRIGVNLAEVQVGRAERALAMVTADYEAAVAELARVMGLSPGDRVEPDGALALRALALPPLPELIRLALENRSDLRAFQQRARAARERLRVIRREVVPNLVIDAFRSTEETHDKIRGAAVSFRIPLFNRRKGEIQEARSVTTRRDEESRALETTIAKEVAAAAASYRAAVKSRDRLQEHVLGRFAESLQLLGRAFEAGKIGWSEVLTFRREFVDAEREYVETLSDAEVAAIQLELALGRDLRPSSEE